MFDELRITWSNRSKLVEFELKVLMNRTSVYSLANYTPASLSEAFPHAGFQVLGNSYVQRARVPNRHRVVLDGQCSSRNSLPKHV
jgi:hypothetical protein